MKKTENIIPIENKKAEVAEVRYLEENQEIENYNPLQSTALPESYKSISKNTYFVLSPNKLKELQVISEKIFKLTNETLLEVIKQKEVEPWMNSRYGVVKSLWQNGNAGINLMRIDFAWDQVGNLKVLELNTSSHSGWIRTGLTEQKSAADKIGIPQAPAPMFYAKYLLEKLGSKIAIMVKGIEYNKELDLLLLQLESLGGEGRIIFLSETALPNVIDFAPTGLFWRCHVALVEHSELVLELAKLGLPQISSFESLFIAGDKSFLAILQAKDTTGTIPKTGVLSKNNLAQNLDWLEKDRVVLKPGDLARGEGIFFGKNFTKKAWEEKIKEVMNSNEEWILQELCYLSKTKDGKYQDIIVFLADGKVQGVSSRVSDHEIVNVAKGGYGQAVVLCSDKIIN